MGALRNLVQAQHGLRPNTDGRETSVPVIKAQHGLRPNTGGRETSVPDIKAQHGWERYGIWSTGGCVTEFGPRSVGLRSVGVPS